MAIKISIANGKGGVAKTTTAVNLADQLMSRGKNVLLVDMDPQCNSTGVYRARTDGVATLYDVMKSGYTADQTIQKTEFGDIIPNDSNLSDADTNIPLGPKMYKHVQKMLKEIEGRYDYIILDTPPHTGILLNNAINASDYLIIPLETEFFSIQGLKDFYENVEDFKEENENLKILGLLRIKYKPKQNLTKELEENTLPKLAEQMGTKILNTTIRESVKVKEANTLRVRLSQYAKGCTAEKDYSQLAEEVIGEVEKCQ